MLKNGLLYAFHALFIISRIIHIACLCHFCYINNNLFVSFSHFPDIFFCFSAYNMVACRISEARNGGQISQVPLKR